MVAVVGMSAAVVLVGIDEFIFGLKRIFAHAAKSPAPIRASIMFLSCCCCIYSGRVGGGGGDRIEMGGGGGGGEIGGRGIGCWG